MKALLLASAAAAALFAAPAMAQDAAGSIGVAYQNTQVEVAGFEDEADGVLVNGSVANQVSDNWTVTLDANLVDSDDQTNVSGTAHLTTLMGDVRVGGFVGVSDSDADTAWTVGAEAQKYLASATLTGAVSYSNFDDLDADVWTVGGDVAFYVQQNLRLNAGLGFSTIDAGGGDEADAWSGNVGAEYQVDGTPFSLTAGYDHTVLDVDIFEVELDTFTVGFRYSFGGGLQARDRAGANLGRTLGGVAGALGVL